MTTPTPSDQRPPVWFTILCIISALPVLAFPTILGMAPVQHSILIKLWPVYAIASAFLAWTAYTRRPAIAWILLALTVLSHAAIFALAAM